MLSTLAGDFGSETVKWKRFSQFCVLETSPQPHTVIPHPVVNEQSVHKRRGCGVALFFPFSRLPRNCAQLGKCELAL